MGRFGSLDDWNVNHQLLQELSNRSSNGSGFSRENSQTGLAFPEGLPDGFNLFRTNIGCHLRRKLLTLTQISNQLLSFSNTFDHACRITTMSKDATSEKEEIFKLFLDQEPIVKKDPKARKEPIKPTNVSPVTIPTVPQETISTISRRSSISSIESINLQDYPPLQERRERLIEKLHN
ncbi:hypothetical protein RhiirA1_477254 [Rhizophagus irregularis]|uniref:Uncharacterized protein n=1 Tax=Rhizophagus irregularis TaxID=588596 RepID=A0A2N0QTU7_9GLOM|nr:hypothetical protein RhiirA1_477254 [Rhizophagus irregularis]